MNFENLIRAHRRATRLGAVTGSAALAVALAGAPATAAAAAGDVNVVNTETVQVYMSPSGSVQSKRIYEQLTMTGHGPVDVVNPVAPGGLRNLDGFSGFSIVHGDQVVKSEVDGTLRTRTVSDYTGKLPLDVKIGYLLDGKPVQPGDVVGKSGHLEVDFTVTNNTSEPEQLTFADGSGHQVTRTVDVPLPMVGSVTTVAPASFTNVSSKAANMAGDGEGGTKLSFTMTLFPPIGSTTATFGYTADISHGVVPRVDVSALPVNPLASPTFASAANSYKGGADAGAQLVDGAAKIDTNLLKLRDGAARLVAGLIELNDGAAKLHQGLAGSAVPGAAKLAAGNSDLADGLVRLHGGARQIAQGNGQFAAGSAKLSAGANQLHKGAEKLAGGQATALAGGKRLTSGLKDLDSGLGQLASQMPEAGVGISKLQAGVQKLAAGLGSVGDPHSIIGGLVALSGGLGSLQAGAGQLSGGLGALAHGDPGSGTPGLSDAKAGLDQVLSGMSGVGSIGSEITSLATAAQSLTTNAACAADPMCAPTANGVLAGINQLGTALSGLPAAQAGLQQVSAGLAAAISAIDGKLKPGADALQAGLGDAVTGAGALEAGAKDAADGVALVSGGLDQLAEKLTLAVLGIGQLKAGSAEAYTGSSDLTGGLSQLSAGADQLSTGSAQLADGLAQGKAGSKKLASGAQQLADKMGAAVAGGEQLADGARQLSDGLGPAATGSGKLADGLASARGQAPAIPNGAQRLSKEGMQKMVAQGKGAAVTYGQMVATLTAGAERAKTGSMVYGAPTDALGLAAYSYVIEGDDGSGRRNVTRVVGGALLLGVAGAVLALRRRRFAAA